MNAGALRERYLRLREEAGSAVTVVVATKYVSLEELEVLAEAGVEVVGENRAQDLQAKHARYGDAFRWHFIGHLQSNKVKVVNGICELVHSLDSESAARRLTVPALLEVNLSDEPSKSGVAPEEIDDWLARVPSIRGLMTMPPLAGEPEASRPWFRRLHELAENHGLRRALDGDVAGLARRGRRGRDADPSRQHPRPRLITVTLQGRSASSDGVTIRAVMGLADVWNRTLVYFGIAEDEEWDDDLTVSDEEVGRDYRRRDRANVRRLPRREQEPWSDQDSVSEPEHEQSPARSSSRRSRLRGVDSGGQVRVHLVLPRSFNDAQQIADRFKDSVPVILNLQNADTDLSKRLIDFASGLTYALDGSMQRVADKVFLLTPRNVEVSAEERARVLDPTGGFFNQA